MITTLIPPTNNDNNNHNDAGSTVRLKLPVRVVVAKKENDDDHGPDNRFVRMSPDVLSALLLPIVGQSRDERATPGGGRSSSPTHPNNNSKDNDGKNEALRRRCRREEWRLAAASTPGMDRHHRVSFLPLEITVAEDSTIVYASYNGGLLPEDCRDTIQVPEGLLPPNISANDHNNTIGNNFNNTTSRVQVRVLDRVQYATRVQVEPLTVEDWELLQVHAELLEGGAFLKQVSVVYRNQQLSLSVSISQHQQQQRDTIQVLVQDISTSTVEALSSSSSSIWPELPDENKSNEKTTGHDDGEEEESDFVALLTSDTEIIITPKPRAKETNRFDPSSWSDALQVIPGALDVIPRRTFTALQDHLLPELLPSHLAPLGCVVVHPSSIAWDTKTVGISEWVQMTSSENTTNGKVVVARLVILADMQENCTVVHPFLRWDLRLPLFWGRVKLRPLIVAPMVSLSLSDIELRKVSLKSDNSGRRLWHDPTGFHHEIDIQDEELDVDLDVNSKHQIPHGSIIAISSEESRNDGNRKKHLFRVVPRPSTGNEILAGGMVTLQLEDVAALKRLVEDSSAQDADQLEFPWTDSLVSAIPQPIFGSTIESLGSFLRDLRRNLPFLGVLSGSTGSGKTHTALVLGAVARVEHRRATLYLDCKRLQDSTTTIVEILAEFDRIFDSAFQSKICLIIFDDLDRIAPNLLGGNEGDPGARAQGANPTAMDQSKLIADRILQLWEAANAPGDASVAVLATCASANSLHQSLRQDHHQKIADVPTLNISERLRLFIHMLQGLGLPTPDVSLPEAVFGQPTEGFRPRDLEKVAARVRRHFAVEEKTPSLEEATKAVLADFISLSHMGLDKPRAKMGLTWGEIGGLFEVKKKLEATLVNPMKYRAIYQRAKIRLPRGVLLLGPTGCGKTALVPALAKECNFPLISCKGPEVLDKYIGASEAKIRELFQRAASVAPSILFLDELDALAPRRGSDHTGVTDRVVNQLLTFLDGVEDTSNATVYVIGASSRPDKIDPALLRPGRLEQHLYVGPPDADEEWVDLFHKIAGGWSLSPECREFVFAKRGIEELLVSVKKNPLFCPADIKAAMDTAQLNAVHRILNLQNAEDVRHVEIEVEDLQAALLSMRPCLNRDDARMLAEIYQRYYPHTKAQEQANTTSPPPPQLKTTLR